MTEFTNPSQIRNKKHNQQYSTTVCRFNEHQREQKGKRDFLRGTIMKAFRQRPLHIHRFSYWSCNKVSTHCFAHDHSLPVLTRSSALANWSPEKLSFSNDITGGY